MIKNTFSMLEGIGPKLEKKLWQSGMLTWADFIEAPAPGFIGEGKKKDHDRRLTRMGMELERSNATYFADELKSGDHWRLFEAFGGQAVALDIETNGWMPDAGGYITMVGLYDGKDYRCLISGRDLSPEGLSAALSKYKYLITFYGSAFDVPFIKKAMPAVQVSMPHFDLCFGARKIGLRGGLKKIEQAVGLIRHEDVRGMDGYDAVLLWERVRRGDARALDLLVQYNKEDTVNLMEIAMKVYAGLRASTGIEEFCGATATGV